MCVYVPVCWVEKKVKSGDIYGIQENIDGLVGDVPLNVKPKTWKKRLLTLTLCLTRLSSEPKCRYCFNGKISFLLLSYWNHWFIPRISNKVERILRSEWNEGERKVDTCKTAGLLKCQMDLADLILIHSQPSWKWPDGSVASEVVVATARV